MPFNRSTPIDSREIEDYQNSIYLREHGEREEAIARHSEYLRRTGRSAKDEFLSKVWSDEQTEPHGASAEFQRIVSMLERMDDYMDKTVTFENLEVMQQGMLQHYGMTLYFCDQYLKKRSGHRFTAQGRKRQQLVQDLRQRIEDEALMLQKGLDEIPAEGEGKTLRSMLTGAKPLNPIIAQARDFSLPSSYQEEEEEAESAGIGAEAGAVESPAAESAESGAADSARKTAKAPGALMHRLVDGLEPEYAGEKKTSDARPAAGPVEGTLAHLRMRRRELRQDASLDKDQSATIQILLEQIDRSVVRGEQALAADLLDRVTELCGDAPEDSTLGLLAQSCRAFKEENGLQSSSEDEAYESSMTLSSRAFEGDEAAQNAFSEYLHLPADIVQQLMVRAAEASDAGQLPSGREQTLIGQAQINETNRILRMQYRRRREAGASAAGAGRTLAAPFRFSDAMYRQAMQTAEGWERMADAARLPGKTRLHRMLNVSYLNNTLGIPTEGGEELPRGAVRRINMQAGKIVMESGFMRTSFAADKTRADLPILLTLLCDEGTPVLPTGNMAQGEILLGRGTSYMILGAVRHGAENALQLPTTHGRFANQQTQGKEGSGAFQGIEIIAKVAGPMAARQEEEQPAAAAQQEEEQLAADAQTEEALPERPIRSAPRPVEAVAAGAPPAELLERQREKPLPPIPVRREEEQPVAAAQPEEALPERPIRSAPRPVEAVAAGAPPAELLERQRTKPLPPIPVRREEEQPAAAAQPEEALPERPIRPAPRPVEAVAAGAPPAELLERQREKPLPPTPARQHRLTAEQIAAQRQKPLPPIPAEQAPVPQQQAPQQAAEPKWQAPELAKRPRSTSLLIGSHQPAVPAPQQQAAEPEPQVESEQPEQAAAAAESEYDLLQELEEKRPLTPEEEEAEWEQLQKEVGDVEEELSEEDQALLQEIEQESAAGNQKNKTKKSKPPRIAKPASSPKLQRALLASLQALAWAYDEKRGGAQRYHETMDAAKQYFGYKISVRDRKKLSSINMKQDIPADQLVDAQSVFSATLPGAMTTYRMVEDAFLLNIIANSNLDDMQKQGAMRSETEIEPGWLASEENRKALIGSRFQVPDALRTQPSMRDSFGESAETKSNGGGLLSKLQRLSRTKNKDADQRELQSNRYQLKIVLPEEKRVLWSGKEGGHALFLPPDSKFIVSEFQLIQGGVYQLTLSCVE